MTTPTPTTKHRRRKWPFRVLWSMLAVVLVAVGFWSWSYYSALAERDALIAEIRARGEPVWWDEVAEKLLAEPTEGTGSELCLKAIWALGGETNPKGPCVPSKQLTDELAKDKFSPRIHPLVEKELKLADPALELLEEAVREPPGRFTKALRNGEPCSIILSEVQDMRRVQRILHWQSFDALAKNDADRAYHAVWMALAATEQLANEPFVIAHVVRLFLVSESLDQLTMCLANASTPKSEFEAIDERLAEWERGFGLAAAIKAERAMWLSTLDQPNVLWILAMNGRRNRSKGGFSGRIDGLLLGAMTSPIGRPILLKAQAQHIRAIDRMAPFIDDPSADASAVIRTEESIQRDYVLSQVLDTTETFGLDLLSILEKRCRRVHRKIVLARVGLRLRRHYDLRGRLPETLDELCDTAMPKIRLEWFNNETFAYKPSSHGFRLESPQSVVIEEERRPLKSSSNTPDSTLDVQFKKIPTTHGTSK